MKVIQNIVDNKIYITNYENKKNYIFTIYYDI